MECGAKARPDAVEASAGEHRETGAVRSGHDDAGKRHDAAASQSTLARTALKGVLWLVLQSLGGRALGLLSQLVLAWILDPSSFGLIGIVYALSSISAALVNFGVDDVLLQRAGLLRFWAAPAFWASLGLSVVGFAVTMSSAVVAETLYGARGVTGLAVFAGLMLPLGALQTVPTVVLRARMDFRAISLFNLGDLAAVQLGTVVLALAGAGAYSFVVPGPIVALVKLVLLWKHARLPVLKRFRPRQLAYMIGNGTAVFLTRLIISAVSQGDYLILGFFSSRLDVGIYFFAFKLAAQPLWILASNFIGVLFPTLIKLRTQPDRQLSAAMTTARLLSFAIMPLCCMQAALADPALRLLFGTKWLGAIPVMQLLSLGLAFDAVTWITGTLLSANREYRRALIYTASFAPLFFGLVLVGARFGAAVGTAGGVALYYAIMGPTMCWLVFRHYGLPARAVAALFVTPTILAAVSVGSVVWVTSSLSDVARIVTIGAVTPLAYAAAMVLFVPTTLDELLRRLVPGHLHGFIDRLLGFRTDAVQALARDRSS